LGQFKYERFCILSPIKQLFDFIITAEFGSSKGSSYLGKQGIQIGNLRSIVPALSWSKLFSLVILELLHFDFLLKWSLVQKISKRFPFKRGGSNRFQRL
jgi:hypothetical protein